MLPNHWLELTSARHFIYRRIDSAGPRVAAQPANVGRQGFRIVYRLDKERVRVVRVWRSERLLKMPDTVAVTPIYQSLGTKEEKRA